MNELDVVLTVSVSPPSAVSTSLLPPLTASRQVVGFEQSIELNELPPAIGSDFHVSPPLLVLISVSGPIA